MEALAPAIARAWADADSADPAPTVAYFRSLLAEYPDHPTALFEYASVLDWTDQEAAAADYYERAFAAGLAGDELRRGLLQYGSTLRNLGRNADAVAALTRADTEFPGHPSVRAFLALALLSAGRANDAVATLIEVALDTTESADLLDYQRALRAYAQELLVAP